MSKLKSICFIDDDPDEIRRFRQCLRDLYIVGAGLRFDDAIEELKKQHIQKPDIILLDLYHGQQIGDAVRSKAIANADEELSKMERKVRALLNEAGQSPDGGFTLAEVGKRKFPGVPILFFSRKAFLEDALRAHERGLPVLPKPDPEEQDLSASDPLEAALCRSGYLIATRIDSMIERNTFWARNGEWLRGFALGIFFFLLGSTWEVWNISMALGYRLLAELVLIVAAVVALMFAWFKHT